MIWRAMSEVLERPMAFETAADVAALAAQAQPVALGEAEAGDVGAAALEVPVAAHYLKHPYLRESAVMAACQDEVGTAVVGKGV